MTLPSLVCVIDHQGRVIEANAAASRWRASADAEVAGKTPHALLHAGCTSENCALRRKWRELWRGMLRVQSQSCELIDPVLQRRLRLRTKRIDTTPGGSHPQGEQYGILRISDIGPSRCISDGERRARVSGREVGTARQIAGAVKRERQRIAAELHDGISQQLALMKLQIESRLAAGLSVEGAFGAEDLLRQVAEGLHGTLREIRQLNGTLVSGGDQRGLVSRLRELCDNADRAQHGTRVIFESPLKNADFLPVRCGEDLLLAIYRIVQEAIGNALKYADARTVKVRLFPFTSSSRRLGELTLSIQDDGRGFDVSKKKPDGTANGLGLMTMRQRALETGGEPSVVSRPGEGTEVRVSWPMVLRAT